MCSSGRSLLGKGGEESVFTRERDGEMVEKMSLLGKGMGKW